MGCAPCKARDGSLGEWCLEVSVMGRGTMAGAKFCV